MEHTHCEDELLTKLPSKDGSLVLVTYHRHCSSAEYTDVRLEKPAGYFQTKGEVTCYISSWRGQHPIEAIWESENSILLRTTDALEQFDLGDLKTNCQGIKLRYEYKLRNEDQVAKDPSVVPKIRKALADTGSCINAYYKSANENNDIVANINSMIDNDEHRSAVENIFGYVYSANCQISRSTFENLEELSNTFDLKSGYLERVRPLVR